MLRSILLVAAISLAAGSIPALAKKSKGSCMQWCLSNRCGAHSLNQTGCLQNCVPTCKKHRKGKK